jgi:uncharacterized protein (TIGR04168 family)
MHYRIGVIGDLHTHWDAFDVGQFSRSDYELLLFTGDLGGGTPDSSRRIARSMSQLQKPALVMPGNNDTFDIAELAAELTHRSGLRRLSTMQRRDMPDESDIAVRLCGYSAHRLTDDVTLIAGRPHSMGGADLSFPAHMLAAYGIDSIDASQRRLCALIDQTTTERLLFLSHNGPLGLGHDPHDMWGCDFKDDGGDWGDPDLSAAVEYAVGRGKRVLAVIAGHMHLRTKHGNERPWCMRRDDILYVNAARVPRIDARGSDVRYHHVELIVDRHGVSATEVFVVQRAD